MCCSVHDFLYNRTWLFTKEKTKQLFPPGGISYENFWHLVWTQKPTYLHCNLFHLPPVILSLLTKERKIHIWFSSQDERKKKKCLSSPELHCLLILGMGEGQNHLENLNILKICYQQTIFISTSHICGIYNDCKNCGNFLLKPLVYAYIYILVYAEMSSTFNILLS